MSALGGKASTDVHTAVLAASPPVHTPALDGIRGIAILLVLASHLQSIHALPRDTALEKWAAALMWSGWTGVDLFFVLSGFLITGILLDTQSARNRICSFYARRTLRIFPLYYLVLSGAALVGLLRHAGVWERLAFVAYVPNWWLIFREPGSQGLGHFWSLGVEEQFYAIWPACVWFIPRKHLAKVCCGAFVGAFLIRLILLHWLSGEPAWNTTLMLPCTRMDSLLAGALCALAVRDRKMLERLRTAIPFVACAALAGMLAIDVLGGETWTRGRYTQLIGFSFLAAGYASIVLRAYLGSGSRTLMDRVLNWPVLVAFGKYSYGVYVYHGILFGLALAVWGNANWYGRQLLPSIGFSLGLVFVSLIVAVVSYHVFEERFLLLKQRFRARYAGASPSGVLPG